MTVITCIVNNLIVDIIWHLLNKFTHDCYVLVWLYWHRNVLSIQPHLDTFPIPIPSKSTTPLSLRYDIRLRQRYHIQSWWPNLTPMTIYPSMKFWFHWYDHRTNYKKVPLFFLACTGLISRECCLNVVSEFGCLSFTIDFFCFICFKIWHFVKLNNYR